MSKTDIVVIASVIGVAIAAHEWLKKQQLEAAARAAANKGGVDAVLTGDPSQSLGTWGFDLFNIPASPAIRDFEPRKLQVREESLTAEYLVHRG